MARWTESQIESQKGKLAIVTGGSSGIGLEAARELARQGADVVIASARVDRGLTAIDDILESAPGASIMYERLDTSDLASVHAFAKRRLLEDRPIDILINNAGIAGSRRRRENVQGFEATFATNYLGHFALTAQLFPLLLRAPEARVVSVSSLMHMRADINFDDLQLEQSYSSFRAYGQSKLAMLLFAREFARRARAEGLALKSIPVHPGGARTNLFHRKEGANLLAGGLASLFVGVFGQSAEQGALPLLFAAVDPSAENGVYYGPDGFAEVRGNPAVAKVHAPGLDEAIAERLWRVSENLTEVRFELAPLQVLRTSVAPEFHPAPQI